MPTASCCRTTSATASPTAPTTRRAGASSRPEEIERVDVMYGPFSAAYSRQLGRRGGRLRDAHAPRGSRPTSRWATSRSPSTCYNTQPDLQRQADQRLARQPQRRLVVVHQRQPQRQPGQPLTFTTATGRFRRAGRRGHTGGRLRAGPEHHQPRPGTSWAPAPSTTRCRTTPKLKLAYDFSPTVTRHLHAGLVAEHLRRAGPTSYLRRRPGQRGLRRHRSTSSGAAFTLAPTAFHSPTTSQTHLHARPLGQEQHQGRRGTGRWRPACTTTRKDQQLRAHGGRCRWRPIGGAGTPAGSGWTARAGTRWQPRAPGGRRAWPARTSSTVGLRARQLQARASHRRTPSATGSTAPAGARNQPLSAATPQTHQPA